MIQRIKSGGENEGRVGYSRAVVAGGMVHVSGTVGQGSTVVEQCEDAIAIIEKALFDAGTDFTHALRVTYMLRDRRDFEECWPVLCKAFGENPPAATMIECGLIDPKYLIEIEVTALLTNLP